MKKLRINNLQLKPLYIGALTGTSMDGIDIGLIKFKNNNPIWLYGKTYSYPKNICEEIIPYLQAKNPHQILTTKIPVQLAQVFAEAINEFIINYKIEREQIAGIGFHGQSIYHAPNAAKPFSIIAGCAQTISNLTNITVVSDFRQSDIQVGGQGAPLAPLLHKILFFEKDPNCMIVNIGGIANITFYNADKEIIGFDTGPGNTLMDQWCKKHTGNNYDKDGKFAHAGIVNNNLLQQMLNDTFFAKKPPKSTGRDYFNLTWLQNYLNGTTYYAQDIQRTLLQLTVASIANIVRKNANIKRLLVCGGGANNKLLMQELTKACKIQTYSTDKENIPADYLEAMLFAWLCATKLHDIKHDLTKITGATKIQTLGKIYS